MILRPNQERTIAATQAAVLIARAVARGRRVRSVEDAVVVDDEVIK